MIVIFVLFICMYNIHIKNLKKYSLLHICGFWNGSTFFDIRQYNLYIILDGSVSLKYQQVRLYNVA